VKNKLRPSRTTPTAKLPPPQQLQQQPTGPCSSRSTTDETTSKNTKLATKYNRLLRQYRFFKSTNMNCPPQTTTTAASETINTDRARPNSSKKILSKCKRRKENNDLDMQTSTALNAAVASAVDPNDTPQNIPAHLFSAFKYWMSKRIDLLNAKTNTTQETLTATTSATGPTSTADAKLNTDMSVSLLASTNTDDSDSNNNNEIYFDSLDFTELIGCHVPPDRLRLTRKFGIETLDLENLVHLSFRNLGVNVIDVRVLNAMLANLKSLKLLDISNCCTGRLSESTVRPELFTKQSDRTSNAEIRHNRNLLVKKFFLKQINGAEAVGSLYGLLHLRSSLTSLIMADMSVSDIQDNLPYILCLSGLRHLDISHCKEASSLNRFTNPSLHLAKIAHHLPELASLDISATNLSGPSLFNESEEVAYITDRLYEDFELQAPRRPVKTRRSSVAGLMFLSCERLEFLGCFCCDHSVSSRVQELPAVRVASEENEQSLYTSLEVYSERPLFVLDVLNHLFELYRDEAIGDKLLGGFLIMNVMEKHVDHSRIQISGCASLFYVLKYWKEENVNVQQLPYFYLKRLISTVIAGMEVHIDDSAMKRNCVLIMCRLNLPEDVLFVSDRLIKILLKIFDDFVKSETKVSEYVWNFFN